MAIAFRASGPIEQVRGNLGLLEELPGTFIGSGFNLIARPDKHNNKPFFLELNATHEILQFIAIGGDIPNRGSMQMTSTSMASATCSKYPIALTIHRFTSSRVCGCMCLRYKIRRRMRPMSGRR